MTGSLGGWLRAGWASSHPDGSNPAACPGASSEHAPHPFVHLSNKLLVIR